MQILRPVGTTLIVGVLTFWAIPGQAQRLQFPATTVQDPYSAGSTGLAPLTPGAASTAPTLGPAPPSATLGPPTFDPYSTVPGAAATPPSLSSPPGGPWSAPGLPGSTIPPQPYGSYPPPGAFPAAAPQSLYPEGMWGPNAASGTVPWGPPLRFLYGPRIRYTWVAAGNDPDDLGINDFDISAAAAFPNFLFSGQPIYVIPSFSLHLWDGPKPPNADLPSKAYSAFVDTYWSSDPQKQIGVEAGVRVGIYSDFNTLTTDSLRIQGLLLGRLRVTPTVTLKAGAMYVDRNKIKLLPAGGILWEPNPRTRFDIYFPKPKLSQYLTTLGNHDLWWYIGGEYGGGSWTIEELESTESIDINDIRVVVGFETGSPAPFEPGKPRAFIDVGWVTDREVLFVADPSRSFRPDDSIMLRAGIGY